MNFNDEKSVALDFVHNPQERKGHFVETGPASFDDLQYLSELTGHVNAGTGSKVTEYMLAYSKPLTSDKLEERRKEFRVIRGRIHAQENQGETIIFHTHPQNNKSLERPHLKHNPLVFLPSYDIGALEQARGDLINTKGGESDAFPNLHLIGGAENIAAPLGVTFHLGVGQVDRADYITAKMRNKQGQPRYPTCKVFTGPMAGDSFENIIEYTKDHDIVGDEQECVMSIVDWTSGRESFFVYVTYDKLKELGISLDDIAFNGGLDGLMEKLELGWVPHAQNLVDAIHQWPEEPSRTQSQNYQKN